MAIVLFLLVALALTFVVFTLREHRHTNLRDPSAYAAGPDDPDALRWSDG